MRPCPRAGAPISEKAILDMLDAHFPRAHSSLLLGRGDDCAILRQGDCLCLSSDLFLEDRHFRRSYFTPAEIGRKALAVNVSDIAAGGCAPLAFSLGLGLPSWVDEAWLAEFFSGMADMAEDFGMALSGGDLSSADSMLVAINVWGQPPPGGRYLERGSCQPGDSLFVAGRIGLARLGLHVLENLGRQEAMRRWPAACAAHLAPLPQISAGLAISACACNGRRPALMDLSDGLWRDLPRLLGAGRPGSGFRPGAELEICEDMLHPEILRYCRLMGLDPVKWAILGGEDYALLGACAPDLLPGLQAAVPGLVPIGSVTDTGRIGGERLPGEEGFDHFAG